MNDQKTTSSLNILFNINEYSGMHEQIVQVIATAEQTVHAICIVIVNARRRAPCILRNRSYIYAEERINNNE